MCLFDWMDFLLTQNLLLFSQVVTSGVVHLKRKEAHFLVSYSAATFVTFTKQT